MMDYSGIYLMSGIGSVLMIGGWVIEDGWPATLFGTILLIGAGVGWLSA